MAKSRNTAGYGLDCIPTTVETWLNLESVKTFQEKKRTLDELCKGSNIFSLFLRKKSNHINITGDFSASHVPAHSFLALRPIWLAPKSIHEAMDEIVKTGSFFTQHQATLARRLMTENDIGLNIEEESHHFSQFLNMVQNIDSPKIDDLKIEEPKTPTPRQGEPDISLAKKYGTFCNLLNLYNLIQEKPGFFLHEDDNSHITNAPSKPTAFFSNPDERGSPTTPTPGVKRGSEDGSVYECLPPPRYRR